MLALRSFTRPLFSLSRGIAAPSKKAQDKRAKQQAVVDKEDAGLSDEDILVASLTDEQYQFMQDYCAVFPLAKRKELAKKVRASPEQMKKDYQLVKNYARLKLWETRAQNKLRRRLDARAFEALVHLPDNVFPYYPKSDFIFLTRYSNSQRLPSEHPPPKPLLYAQYQLPYHDEPANQTVKPPKDKARGKLVQDRNKLV
eukprot:gnl/Hemi2/25049_TR8426_c0_g1_i1.p1 gnl/Hemi2/25049_TR8426_c0_g1~~gnl/Hemi2/25049_TR8426_c0_g1_i1.p1  ORF type:complete len:210 (+),score=25.04 gnl/Hemi2/25049_TR8426_c0_g1_i1:34-630(+)